MTGSSKQWEGRKRIMVEVRRSILLCRLSEGFLAFPTVTPGSYSSYSCIESKMLS